MRALFFDDAQDERIWDFPDQFRLGSALLIAPVTQPGAGSREVYLPHGEWVDVWTGHQHTGGKVVERATPLDIVPVFATADRWADLEPLFSTGN
ncbi:hypothetical protein ACWDA7_44320 [Streptomyces sp. NPDC001156]